VSQADQTVQNDTFPTVRADINNNLAALFSNSSGGTAPSVTVAYQDWIDTSGANPVWKKRNAANNAWITLGTIVSNSIAFEGTLPSQSGNSGKYLTTDGTDASWGVVPLNVPDSAVNTQTFTTSGTWTKPASGTWALVRCWGGGGSGAKGASNAPGGGGGGGACVEKLILLSSLGATETVTIGAGGAAQTTSATPGNTGGNTTFGSHVTAYGGGGGNYSTSGGGGGGGGGGGSAGEGSSVSSSGSDGGLDLADKWQSVWVALNVANPNAPSAPYVISAVINANTTLCNCGADGGGSSSGYDNLRAPNEEEYLYDLYDNSYDPYDLDYLGGYGGAGGGKGVDGTGSGNQDGGDATWGGAGGGGAANSGTPGDGGTSTYGGDGGGGAIDGNAATAGSQPGGGGGGTEGGDSGAGGAGQCIVYVY